MGCCVLLRDGHRGGGRWLTVGDGGGGFVAGLLLAVLVGVGCWVWAEPVESFACMWELRCADSHSFGVSVWIFNLGGRGQCWRGLFDGELG